MPLDRFFFGGVWVSPAKIDYRKKCPYSNLSTGGPSSSKARWVAQNGAPTHPNPPQAPVETAKCSVNRCEILGATHVWKGGMIGVSGGPEFRKVHLQFVEWGVWG